MKRRSKEKNGEGSRGHMKMETMTLQDCVLYSIQGLCAILNDGKLIGFQQEEIPTQTANPSGDE